MLSVCLPKWVHSLALKLLAQAMLLLWYLQPTLNGALVMPLDDVSALRKQRQASAMVVHPPEQSQWCQEGIPVQAKEQSHD